MKKQEILKIIGKKKTCTVKFTNGTSTKAKVGSYGVKLSYGKVLSFDEISEKGYLVK